MKYLKTTIAALSCSVAFAASASAADCTIALTMPTLNAPYFAAMDAAVIDEATKLGCEVITSDAQRDMLKQISDIEDYVAQGVDVLIVNATDVEGIVPAVNNAVAAGISVIALDTSLSMDANYVTLINSPNVGNGKLVGHWLAKELGGKPANIAILSGNKGNTGGEDRRMGVIWGLVEGQLVNYGNATVNIVAQGWGGWSQEGGLTAMEDLLTAHPEINVVYGENDSMMLGAHIAAKAAGRDDILLLAAADGQREAYELILTGEYGATGLNDPDVLARLAVKFGLEHSRGELPADFPKHYVTEPAVISSDNIDKYYDPESVF